MQWPVFDEIQSERARQKIRDIKARTYREKLPFLERVPPSEEEMLISFVAARNDYEKALQYYEDLDYVDVVRAYALGVAAGSPM